MKISLIIFSLFICFAACAVHHIPLHRSKSHESTPKNLPKLYTQDLDGYAMIPNVTTLTGTVSIGSPAQNFTVFLDTNSSDFWVGGQNCSGFLGTNTYNSSASPMFVGLLDDFNSTYSLGYVTGSMGMDVVSFAGLDVGYMDIGIASDISLFAIPVDGVLGLGFPQLNSYDGMGLMEQIMSNKDLNETGFSLYLSSNYSALILGGVDSKYAKSKFTYYPIAGDGYWSFFGNLSMEGVSLAEELELAIQTASSNILFPEVIFGTFLIYTGLKYENVYQPDIVHFLRSIEVQVGSETLIIPPEAYMLCTEAQCSLAVQIQLPGVNKITLGDQFLQTYYTHFDYQNMRIGFAEPAL